MACFDCLRIPLGQMGVRRQMTSAGETWSSGTYHRSVGIGDPKNGQSNRVLL